MTDLFKASVPDQIAELECTLKQRERLYPRDVERGYMPAHTANWRISCLRSAIGSLRVFQQMRENAE